MRVGRTFFATFAILAASEASAQTRVPVPTSEGPFRRIPNAGAVVKSGVRPAQDPRRVCRGKSPRGWVAIEYVTDTIACPTKHGKSAENGAAILVSVSDLPVGAEIEVCADQGTPRNFARLHTVDAPGRCLPVKPTDKPTVVVIRRSR